MANAWGAERAQDNAALALQGEYVDTHNWVMTPHHSRLLLLDLNDLGFIGLREKTYQDTLRHEFHITLAPDGAGPGLSREQLAMLSARELMTPEGLSFG